MKSIIKENVAYFYFLSYCKRCKSIQEVEMIMSKSAFNTVKVVCTNCKSNCEFEK